MSFRSHPYFLTSLSGGFAEFVFVACAHVRLIGFSCIPQCGGTESDRNRRACLCQHIKSGVPWERSGLIVDCKRSSEWVAPTSVGAATNQRSCCVSPRPGRSQLYKLPVGFFAARFLVATML